MTKTPNGEYITAMDGGINWTWYLQVKIVSDDSCEVICYDRWHRYEDDNHPQHSTYVLRQSESDDGNRTLLSVTIQDDNHAREMKVINPKHKFDYKDRGHLTFKQLA